LQVRGTDVLVALDLEALDRGTFEHGDDERAAVAAELHVLKETCCTERPNCFAYAARIQRIADVDGQVVVNRPLGDALQALYSDVAIEEVRRVACRFLRASEHCWQQRAYGDFDAPSRSTPDASACETVAGICTILACCDGSVRCDGWKGK